MLRGGVLSGVLRPGPDQGNVEQISYHHPLRRRFFGWGFEKPFRGSFRLNKQSRCLPFLFLDVKIESKYTDL